MIGKKKSLLRRLLDRAFPRAPDFYLLLNGQCDLSLEAMTVFAQFMKDGDRNKGVQVRELEHRCDDLKHQNMDQLNRSFSTPMDRDDIYRAISTIDDVVGYAKTTVRELEILQVTPDEPMQEMAALLLEGMQSLHQGYAKLRSKPLDAEADARKAHKTERETEDVYRHAVAKLFDEQRIRQMAESGDVHAEISTFVEMLRRREVYRHMSNAADKIEVAAETLHNIIVKIA
ncbi:hypothetical protein Pan97_16130 [Bremerella volcania]|uniref:Pit accessory protein n=1 Tax=Bremerella volcania TaxID=2527984 RepID=A0A518C5U9_9BACT|nr:DUF47 family protein [Bremerella volcania]QDU74603.1 hypothetical protein Pan97_16130 [Bremerella volcania]